MIAAVGRRAAARRLARAAGTLAAAALLLGAGAALAEMPSPPAAANAPWQPREGEKPAPLAVPQVSTAVAAIAAGSAPVTLAQVLDLALRNSPRTRETWLAAKAAAAEVGVQSAQYFPTLDVGGNVTRTHQAQLGGTVRVQQTTYGPTADFAYTLFDFGGRRADVEEARQALLAADWMHNAAIQDVVLNVQEAYYGYLSAASVRQALLESIQQAQVSVDSAEDRRKAGLATIADVLQARTLLEQEKLALAETEGEMNSIKGALATAVGLPPDMQVEVSALEALPKDLPATGDVGAPTEEMGRLLRRALADRPDLLSQRAEVLAARARVTQERSAGLPTLSLLGSGNRTFYEHVVGSRPSTNYSAQVVLRWPLFNGFETRFKVAKAQAEADAEAARLDSVVQQSMLDVWTTYYKLQTAAQSVTSTRALVDSASQSAEVSGGRYREGVGSILDLLTAQSALASARSREIQARAQWFIALAELQHATGSLGLAAPTPAASADISSPDHASAPQGTP